MKYLVSLYLDKNTSGQIQQYMEAAAKASGNHYMFEHNVPPHITLSSFEAEDAEEIAEALNKILQNKSGSDVQWVGTGAFMSSVLYLTPVLSRYLQELAEEVYDCVCSVERVEVSRYYRPYQWLPHTTIGKKLSPEELCRAFDAVQPSFHIIKGKVTAVGLAKASPYEDIITWNLI